MFFYGIFRFVISVFFVNDQHELWGLGEDVCGLRAATDRFGHLVGEGVGTNVEMGFCRRCYEHWVEGGDCGVKDRGIGFPHKCSGDVQPVPAQDREEHGYSQQRYYGEEG